MSMTAHGSIHVTRTVQLPRTSTTEHLPSFSLLRELQNQNVLEIDLCQSNTTGTLYGNWAAETRLHIMPW